METPIVPLERSQEENILEGINYPRSKLSEDLASLKLWTSQQQHFPPSAHQEPDAFFNNYLVGCKGNLKRAQEKIDNYYRYRSRAREFCADRDVTDEAIRNTWPHFISSAENSLLMTLIENFSAHSQVLTLPKATPDGSRIFMSVTGKSDYQRYDPVVIMKRIICILDMMMRTEPIQSGMYIVLNGANFSTSYLLSVLRPSFLKNVLHFLQNVMPFRIKGIISINTPSYLQVAINRVIKPLMKQKIAKRVHVYTEGFEALTRHFSPGVLPNDYGGHDESLQSISDKWMEFASSSYWREWFKTKGVETVNEPSDATSRSLLNFWR